MSDRVTLRCLPDGVCNKCGQFGIQSAGCTHGSCGGTFVAGPHKFIMDRFTERCKVCNHHSWESGYHL